jgi:hypothetical protein
MLCKPLSQSSRWPLSNRQRHNPTALTACYGHQDSLQRLYVSNIPSATCCILCWNAVVVGLSWQANTSQGKYSEWWAVTPVAERYTQQLCGLLACMSYGISWTCLGYYRYADDGQCCCVKLSCCHSHCSRQVVALRRTLASHPRHLSDELVLFSSFGCRQS